MSIAISTTELAQMRSDIEELLPDTGNILEKTQVSDGQGGFTDSWGTATADVACRVDAQKGDESLSADRQKPFNEYMLTLPHGTTIMTANRFEHGSNTYNVTGVNEDQSWIGCKRVVLEKI